MNGDPVTLDAMLAWGIIAAGLLASLAAWSVLWERKRLRRPWVVFQPRRPVPWNVLAVGGVVGLYLLGSLATATVVYAFYPGRAVEAEPQAKTQSAPTPADVVRDRAEDIARGDAPRERVVPPREQERGNEHVLTLIMRGRPEFWVIALCLISAVVVAPIWEEIFFRLVLQGWLERVEAHFSRHMRIPAIARGMAPVLFSAVLFAIPHIRPPMADQPVSLLILVMAAHASGSVVLTLGVLLLLRKGCGATAIDLGWDRRHFWRDARRGALAFVAIMAPLFGVQAALKKLLQAYGLSQVAPDPVAIFLLALVLGYLYFRTHRIVASIAMHMALNATTMALLLLGLG